MDTRQMIADWCEMWPRLNSIQRDAMISCFAAANSRGPDSGELWGAVAALATAANVRVTSPEPRTPETFWAMRSAMDALEPDDWRTFNNVAFALHRGNVFDEQFECPEGGGIVYTFVPRYLDFLSILEAERIHLGIEEPTMLDVGCWQGTLMLEMAQRRFHVTGTDIGEALGEVVAERTTWLKPEAQARVHGFRAGWAHEVLPEMGQFDIVTSQETLEHVPTAVLQETCDAILGAARHTVLMTVPGWDDTWAAHLRVFTGESLSALFHPEENEVEVLRAPGVMCYTTVRVRKKGAV